MSGLWSYTRGWLAAVVVLLAGWGVAGGVQAQCAMTVIVTPVVVAYNGALATATFDVSVRNTSASTCNQINFGIANTSISVNGTAGGLTAGLPLAYAAQFDLAGLDPLPLNSTNPDRINVVLNTLQKQTTSNVTQVTLRIPAGQSVPAGQSSFSFVAYAYWSSQGQNPAGVFNSTQQATINVQDSFSMSLAGGGTATTLNFMNLTTNATRSVMLNVQASGAYRITMASTLPNPVPGRLQLVGDSNPAWSIPYTATLAGQSISTSSPLLFSTGTTGGNTVQSLFEVRIGAVGNVRAGVYREVLTLTIAANP